MELSNDQQSAFDKYVAGNNIFITGPGGAGKSALIRQIYADALNKGRHIQVCAMTGCAAILLNCKAKTLHSWAGIGLGTATIEDLVFKIKKNKFVSTLWRDIHVLIVDEVSMLSLKLFNLLNELGKIIRNNFRPFGGIQLVFSGDFFQLPPVGDSADIDTQRFCFESDDWFSVFTPENHILLIKIFRQKDQVYSTLLNQIREGKIKRKNYELLLSYVDRPKSDDLVIEPTKLFPIRSKVENINRTKMTSLEGDEVVYNIKFLKNLTISRTEKYIKPEFKEKDIQIELEFLSNNLLCDKEIRLKIGSQVMCVVNIPSDTGGMDICNGSQGIVIGFCETTKCPCVQFNNGLQRVMIPHTWQSDKIPGIGVSQVPLILAWALTIHKSQGATLDAAEIDVGSDIFECGQTYVALSRVKSLDGLYLTGFDVTKIKINRKVSEFYELLHNKLEV
jgi:ATP-dependent DNA helicase PIF1